MTYKFMKRLQLHKVATRSYSEIIKRSKDKDTIIQNIRKEQKLSKKGQKDWGSMKKNPRHDDRDYNREREKLQIKKKEIYSKLKKARSIQDFLRISEADLQIIYCDPMPFGKTLMPVRPTTTHCKKLEIEYGRLVDKKVEDIKFIRKYLRKIRYEIPNLPGMTHLYLCLVDEVEFAPFSNDNYVQTKRTNKLGEPLKPDSEINILLDDLSLTDKQSHNIKLLSDKKYCPKTNKITIETKKQYTYHKNELLSTRIFVNLLKHSKDPKVSFADIPLPDYLVHKQPAKFPKEWLVNAQRIRSERKLKQDKSAKEEEDSYENFEIDIENDFNIFNERSVDITW